MRGAEAPGTVRCRLRDLCGVRSGDKADTSDLSLFADDAETYELVRAQVTAEAVAAHFGELVAGPVVRYEVPGLWALKFVLHAALGGGSSCSIRADPQGKTYGLSLLRMWVEVPTGVLERSKRRQRPPQP